mgnify:CR=1 FL=1
MRFKKIIATAITVGLVMTSFAAMQVQGASLKLNYKKATLNKGETLVLKLKGAKKIKWSSSKKNVASVTSKGKVTAKKKGTAKITAKVGKKKYSCTVKVETPKLNKTKLTLDVGKTYALKLLGSTQKVKWSSSNKKVATVTSKGIISAVGVGNAKITAKAGKTNYKCSLSVVQRFGKLSGNVTYFYNNFVGNRADTSANVFLIPKDGRASKIDLEDYYSWGLPSKIEKIGVYVTYVDGAGNYNFDHIPVGDYICFIKSSNTTTKQGFDEPVEYKKGIANAVKGYITNTNAEYLGEYVSHNSYTYKSISIYENDTTNYSFDFGVTYI